GLFEANDSQYASRRGISGVKGVRQHTTYDQYDKFAKAIRFNGNALYGGNGESVINDSVIPQIYPRFNEDGFDTKKLMFSIENLAYDLNDDGSFENGKLPLCEVGPSNGRIMWFPPYAISINENTEANYESTVMLGRNEPMYNYLNTERSANIKFKLLIDFPEQLKNKMYRGQDKHKVISEFFAFGGDPEPDYEKDVSRLELKIKERTERIDEIKNPTKSPNESKPEPDSSFKKHSVYFPNDMPNSGQINNIFNLMYNTLHYEMADDFVIDDISNIDTESKFGTPNGLNENIYVTPDDNLENVTDQSDIGRVTYLYKGFVEQYNNIYDSTLTDTLKKLMSNENNRGLFKIKLTAYSSKLYEIEEEREEYNRELAERRAQSVAELIRARVNALFDKDEISEKNVDDFIADFDIVNEGDTQASSESGLEENIYTDIGKNERRVEISIERTSDPIPSEDEELSTEDIEELTILQDEISSLQTELSQIKNKLNTNCHYFNDNDDGVLNGFKSISKNNYYPIFHTQTPQDFHRRLTFLQQCMRQGASAWKSDSGDVSVKNSVFGRQPICVMRIGDFFYSKVIIQTLNIDYDEPTWDMNPEGFGLQPMIADITLQLKIIGGQSLKGPIDALQNAISFNYYANSTYKDTGVYKIATEAEQKQSDYENSIETTNNQNNNNDNNNQ
ncbi:MAG: hypothetical protein ACOC2W_03935, partial [bacterium]